MRIGTWRDFWNGVTQPSGLRCAVTFAIPLAVFVGLTIVISPALIRSGGDKYLAKNGRDLDMFATSKALTMAVRENNSPIVVVLGASAIHNSLIEEQLVKVLDENLEFPIDVYDLSTSRQSFWQATALVDMIPARSRGVVVLSVGCVKLTFGSDILAGLIQNPRLGFRSKAYDAEILLASMTPPRRVGIYLWDNMRFFLPRLRAASSNLANGPIDSIYYYLGREQKDDEEWRSHSEQVAERLDFYYENVEGNLDILSRIINRIREKTDMTVVLVEHPVSDRFVREFVDPALIRQYEDRLRQFTKEHNVEYWDLIEAAAFSDDDYYDWCHLRSKEATSRFTAIIGRRLAELLSTERRADAALE